MPATADHRHRDVIDLRDARPDRLVELVAHLTDAAPAGATPLVASDWRPGMSADEALRLTAHVMVELRDATTASVRVAPYLGRLRHRHEPRPDVDGTAETTDRFDRRFQRDAHRPLRQWNRPTGSPGPGRTVAG